MSDNRFNRVIYPHHIEKVLEVNERTARRVMSRMRKRFGKEKHQPVILQHLLDYTGLALEFVLAKLGWQ